MTIITDGFLGSLFITRGFGGSVVVPLVVYIDPRACQLYSTGSDADPFGVDPRAAQLTS